MKKRRIRPPKVEFEFTDLDLTAFGGASVLAQTARQFGLFELLGEAVSVKVRNRGASDTETLWAIFATHRPSGWEREQHCMVVRRRIQGGQLLLVPRHTVILVSGNELALKDLVHRHRGKQGQENAFKGPLRPCAVLARPSHELRPRNGSDHPSSRPYPGIRENRFQAGSVKHPFFPARLNLYNRPQ